MASTGENGYDEYTLVLSTTTIAYAIHTDLSVLSD